MGSREVHFAKFICAQLLNVLAKKYIPGTKLLIQLLILRAVALWKKLYLTVPDSPSLNFLTPVAWHDSHLKTNLSLIGMTAGI